MSNFEARVRTDYSSIEGLVLNCPSTALSLDGSEWINTAPTEQVVRYGSHTGSGNSSFLYDQEHFFISGNLVGCTVYNLTDGSSGLVTANDNHSVTATLSGGVDNDWDQNDEYEIWVPRFGNPYQDNAALRPTVSEIMGVRQANFTAGSKEFFKIPLDRSFLSSAWTIAFDYLTKAAVGASHYVIGFPNIDVHRQNAAGNFGYMHNGTIVNGAGDMPSGMWVYGLLAANGVLWNGNIAALGGSGSVALIAEGDSAGFIASDDGVTNYCDIILAGVYIWRRALAAIERDFAYDTMAADGTSYSSYARVVPSLNAWTDLTGTGDQVSRLNTIQGYPQRFYMASIPTGTYRRVQFSASIDGLVVADTALGGELFSIDCIEYPSAGKPAVFGTVGWSSVFDINLSDPGHYTFVISRPNGGSAVIHLDVEAI